MRDANYFRDSWCSSSTKSHAGSCVVSVRITVSLNPCEVILQWIYSLFLFVTRTPSKASPLREIGGETKELRDLLPKRLPRSIGFAIHCG